MSEIYIYIYIVIWYESDMKYVMEICDKLTCSWYDILWCDMLWYEMYMRRCYVKSMERYVMSIKLYVYSMKYNSVRFMYDMRTGKMRNDMIWMISDMWNDMICTERWGVIFNNDENRKILRPHACVLMHWEISLFHHEGTDTYTTRRVKYHYVLHNAAMTITNSNGFPA